MYTSQREELLSRLSKAQDEEDKDKKIEMLFEVVKMLIWRVED